jgi:hypothetical protein
MSLYAKFETSVDREVEGIPFEFTEAGMRVTLARAGGANKAYGRAITSSSARIRRALETNTMTDADARKLLATAYADAVIKRWETLVDGEWKDGIEGPDGNLLPFNRQNVVDTLLNLPTLLETLKGCAEDWQIFLRSTIEGDAKNS